MGIAPMEYLLAWRMALAKDLLRRQAAGIAEVAQRVGYSSASTFSVAFARHVGLPPSRYARRGGCDAGAGSNGVDSIGAFPWSGNWAKPTLTPVLPVLRRVALGA